MNVVLSLFLFVLPLVYAGINVVIDGKFENVHSPMQVHCTGNQADVISPRERDAFGLGDESLKNAVNANFGKRPDDAFLTSPTPWGDLYQVYKWKQVTRTLVPRIGRVIRTNAQPVVVLEQVFENKSTKPATFNVGISHSVENTVSSTWTKSRDLTISQDIGYLINIGFTHFGGAQGFTFTSGWGVDNTKSKAVTIGASSSMEILLKPGQSVVTELQATKGNIQVEVDYVASLSGAVAVNYRKGFKDHHFWGLPVEKVMSSGGIKNEIVSKQIINIGFYAQSKVVVRDSKSGGTLLASV